MWLQTVIHAALTERVREPAKLGQLPAPESGHFGIVCLEEDFPDRGSGHSDLKRAPAGRGNMGSKSRLT